MRYVVTGGAGFIGTHLCNRLLLDGHDVLCVDNLHSGSKRNVERLSEHSRFEFFRHDVTLPLHVDGDFIINLACLPAPIHYEKEPIQTTMVGVIGMSNVLDLAHRLCVPILQVSTSEVYGEESVSPQTEECWGRVNPVGIRSCYEESKRLAEALCFAYHRQHGLGVKIIRLFNVYGPGLALNDGRVISTFVRQALDSGVITIFGSGKQRTSFCYVSDAVEGLVRMAEADAQLTGPLNVGSPTTTSVRELAGAIFEVLGLPPAFGFVQAQRSDGICRCPDIEKAKSLLGWSPSVDFDKGLRETVLDLSSRLRETFGLKQDHSVHKNPSG